MIKFRKIKLIDKLKLWSGTSCFPAILCIKNTESNKNKYDEICMFETCQFKSVKKDNDLWSNNYKFKYNKNLNNPSNQEEINDFNLIINETYRIFGHRLEELNITKENGYFYYYFGQNKLLFHISCFIQEIIGFKNCFKIAWKYRNEFN